MENKKFCKFCGKEIDKDLMICPKCGRQLKVVKKEGVEEKAKKEEQPTVQDSPKFYTQVWFMWVMLIFFAPVGIFIMWKFHPEMKKNTKIIITVIFAILFLIVFANYDTDNSNTTNEVFNDSSSSNSTTVNEKKVEVADFKSMKESEILTWCKENNLNCDFTKDYSDTISKGAFIKQSPEAKELVAENSTITITYSLGKAPTKGQENALKKAKSYLDYSAFSRKGLIKQLEFEGFTHEEAVYGVDNVDVDWKEQAVEKAKSYLSYSAFSRNGLIKQLEFEGFTHDQAVYGVTKNGL